MTPISQIKTYPNKAPVDAVQAKIVAVYEYRSMPSKFGPGNTTCQNIEIQDVVGNKIRVSVWDHPDMTEHKGKEYVFHAGHGGKGLEVRHGSYQKNGETVATVELSMSKAGRMQFVEVYRQSNPTAAVSEPAKAPIPAQQGQGIPSPAPVRPARINGEKVGMALNNAVRLMVAADMEYSRAALKKVAEEIIEVSNELENPEAYPVAKPVAAMTHQEKVEANIDPAKTPKADEDVPF